MTIDFSKFTSVKIGGIREVLVINDITDIFKQDFKDRVIIGGGNNLLVSDNPVKTAILGENFDYIKLEEGMLEIGAATKSGKIYNFAKKYDLGGFEFLQNIPGTLGGMIKMNAGLCGVSISDNLLAILINDKWVLREDINFSYRKSRIDGTIFAAKFRLGGKFNQALADSFAEKRRNQPKGASFGSCFINPEGDHAGRLIESVGLKGYAIGGAKFSEKHANFLINFNRATFKDAKDLIELAKTLVVKRFNIYLETEVVII